MALPFVNTPFVDLVVGPQRVNPLSVLVKQADFAHEVMTCVADTQLLPYGGREEGQPVRVTWGHFPGNTSTFYGYVHHTEPYYDKDVNNTVKLVCLGASSELSAPIQASWNNQTADAIARDVIEAAYLSVDAESHSQVWPVMTATGGTAWEFLIQLANKVGYRLRPLGTEVRFCSPVTLFGRYFDSAPTMDMGAELLRYRLQSDSAAGLLTQRTAYGLSQREGRLFTVTDLGDNHVTRLGREIPDYTDMGPANTVVDSPGDGAAKLAGEAAATRFTYAASAELLGDTIVSPGRLVYLNGLESSQNGHWYIQGAEHDVNLRTGDYTVYADLRRDALGALAAAPMPGIVRPQLHQTASGELLGVEPPAALVNGQWRSSWARRAS